MTHLSHAYHDLRGRVSDLFATLWIARQPAPVLEEPDLWEGVEDDTPDDIVEAMNADLLAVYHRECGHLWTEWNQ